MRTQIALVGVAVLLHVRVGRRLGPDESTPNANAPAFSTAVGWENMKAEAWDKAAKSFQAAVDIDQTYELAYYMLGRANMAAQEIRRRDRRILEVPRPVPRPGGPAVLERSGGATLPEQ